MRARRLPAGMAISDLRIEAKPAPGGLRLEGGYARDALRWRFPPAGAPLPAAPPVLERWSAGGGRVLSPWVPSSCGDF